MLQHVSVSSVTDVDLCVCVCAGVNQSSLLSELTSSLGAAGYPWISPYHPYHNGAAAAAAAAAMAAAQLVSQVKSSQVSCHLYTQ